MPAETTRLNTFLFLVEKGLRKIFDGALKTHPEMYKGWLQTKRAKEWIEDDRIMSGFGPMPEKPVGNPFTVDRPLDGPEKDFTLKPYGLAFVIEHELLKWDQYGKFTKPTKMMARSGIDRKNILAYSILNNAFSTSDAVYQTYNGEVLCTSSHVLLRGGTGANAPASAVGITYVGIQNGLTDLALTENEDGLYAVVKGKLLICHPSKEWVADTQLHSDYRPDNANMAKNTLSGKLQGPHSSPYLTSTTAWWIVADKSELEACFTIGQDLMFRKDYQQSTWNSTWSMYMSARVEILTWPGFWGTAGV